MDLFVEKLFHPETRFFFLAWVFIIIVSIVLHELAHGWAAISRGDDTPIREGRMTGNPLVHMGPWSLLALAIIGIAWGQMPIDPSRFRGKYAEAFVAAAGPAMNLLLFVLFTVSLGLLMRFGILVPGEDEGWRSNLIQLLWIGAAVNLLLCAFNLLPAPPLDGSHILANFNKPYARLLSDPSKQGVLMLGFLGAVVLLNIGMDPLITATQQAVRFIAYG